jgi:hypothetical protein
VAADDGQVMSATDFADFIVFGFHFCMSLIAMPNKSPEPTPIIAVSSATRLDDFHAAWLSFFR